MIWYVAVGSAFGGAARFLLTALVQQRAWIDFLAARGLLLGRANA